MGEAGVAQRLLEQEFRNTPIRESRQQRGFDQATVHGSSSVNRVTPGAAGFLVLSQAFDGPAL